MCAKQHCHSKHKRMFDVQVLEYVIFWAKTENVWILIKILNNNYSLYIPSAFKVN